MDRFMDGLEAQLDGVRVERRALHPGMWLAFWRMEAGCFPLRRESRPGLMAVNYCRVGELEWALGSGSLCLGPGDFSLHLLDGCADSTLRVPAGGCQGLSLFVDLHRLEAEPPGCLAGAGLGRAVYAARFWRHGPAAVLEGNRETEAVFSGFYGQPEHLALPYQRLKCAELLLYLGKLGAQAQGPLTEYRADQVAVVREIHDQLTQNIGRRLTIEALSQQYLMNPTTLKEVFKAVYGNSLAAHIKEHRMELAAQLLRETGLSIAEIGQRVGYESQSKFAAAFKSFYHILPSEYRKKP